MNHHDAIRHFVLIFVLSTFFVGCANSTSRVAAVKDEPPRHHAAERIFYFKDAKQYWGKKRLVVTAAQNSGNITMTANIWYVEKGTDLAYGFFDGRSPTQVTVIEIPGGVNERSEIHVVMNQFYKDQDSDTTVLPLDRTSLVQVNNGDQVAVLQGRHNFGGNADSPRDDNIRIEIYATDHS